jgi:acyl-CoA oxidase
VIESELAALRAMLDGRWASVRADLRRRLGDQPLRPDPTWSTEEHRARVTEMLRKLAADGMFRAGFPSAYGGADDIGGSVVAIEMLAYADLSLMVKAGVQFGLFGGAVTALGTERHHRRYLPAIMDFELPGCFAMTETGHGSNVAAVRTTATYDPASDEFVVHSPTPDARKDYIGNAARDGQLAVVFAQLITPAGRHGVHALLVPIRDAGGRPCPGVEISDCGVKAGLNGVDNGRLRFDSVRVPRVALLDRYGQVAPDGSYHSEIENENRRFFTMLGTLIKGRVSVAGSVASATQSALAIALRYGLRRRQFSAPGSDQETLLLDHSAHRRKLLPALATSYALAFAEQELVGALHDKPADSPDAPGRQRELEVKAAGMKAVSTWHATRTIQTCREACGGAGYLAENLLPGLKADTDVFTTFEGDNTVLLQQVAKGLLTEYQHTIGDLDTLEMIRFVAERVVGAIAEATSARSLAQRFRDPDRFDPEWHRSLLADRDDHVLAGLARRLRRAAEPGADAAAIIDAAQSHMLAAATAHIECWVFDCFDRAVHRCEHPETAELLATVRALYALATVYGDRAWFLEHGRLTTSQTRVIDGGIDELCARLRPKVELLVAGFGIPEAWLDAVILREA